jgi:hypothetical protein
MTTMNDMDRMQQDAELERAEVSRELEDVMNLTGVGANKMSQIVTIYSRETGEPRTMPRFIAEVALLKRFRSREHKMYGEKVFSLSPEVIYYEGGTKCWLHPSSPNREEYDKWGIPVCDSEHIASPGEVVNHMRKRHSSAYNLIQSQEQDKMRRSELEATRASTEAMREALSALVGRQSPSKASGVEASAEGSLDAPLYVSDKVKKTRTAKKRKVAKR